jgi:hypothetical protein
MPSCRSEPSDETRPKTFGDRHGAMLVVLGSSAFLALMVIFQSSC